MRERNTNREREGEGDKDRRGGTPKLSVIRLAYKEKSIIQHRMKFSFWAVYVCWINP